VLTGIAVEVREPKGIGRCRMAVLADASAEPLHPFITGAVDPGARVITHGWNGYIGLDGLGYTHDRRSQRAARARGDDPGELLPAVHRVASLGKRWLLGTQLRIRRGGALARLPQRIRLPIQPPQLAQPRHALVSRDGTGRRARADPVRRHPYRQEAPRQGASDARQDHPSLERPAANRPWRTTEMQLRFHSS
jgi:hypothetical protein